MVSRNSIKEKAREMLVSPQEEKLIRFFRQELQYGEAKVVVKNGQPVNIWIALKNVKLD